MIDDVLYPPEKSCSVLEDHYSTGLMHLASACRHCGARHEAEPHTLTDVMPAGTSKKREARQASSDVIGRDCER